MPQSTVPSAKRIKAKQAEVLYGTNRCLVINIKDDVISRELFPSSLVIGRGNAGLDILRAFVFLTREGALRPTHVAQAFLSIAEFSTLFESVDRKRIRGRRAIRYG
jgi:hypothetical protein